MQRIVVFLALPGEEGGILPPGARAIEPPLPVTGEYVLYVNGIEMEKRLGPPPQKGRIDVSKAVMGIGDVAANSIANRFAWDRWGTRGGATPEPSGILGPVKLLASEE